MNIRTTTLGTANSMLNYITSSESKYYQLAEEASSGEKVSKPSDDPTATKSILNITSQLSQLSGYLKNMSTSQTELDTLDNSLSSLSTMIENASSLATQASSDTYSSDYSTIKTQIDSILGSVVDLSNTQYDGNYIFSGTATSTKTYTTDASGNITYNGSDTSTDAYQRYVTISDGVSVGINADGESLFGSYSSVIQSNLAAASTDVAGTVTTSSTDAAGNIILTSITTKLNGDGTKNVTTATGDGIIGTLKILSNALGNEDSTTVRTTLDSLTSNLNTTLATQTKFASVTNQFTITENSINSTVTNLKSYKSDLKDCDLSEVLSDLTTQKLAMQATYQVTSQMLGGTSLLDYL